MQTRPAWHLGAMQHMTNALTRLPARLFRLQPLVWKATEPPAGLTAAAVTSPCRTAAVSLRPTLTSSVMMASAAEAATARQREAVHNLHRRLGITSSTAARRRLCLAVDPEPPPAALAPDRHEPLQRTR